MEMVSKPIEAKHLSLSLCVCLHQQEIDYHRNSLEALGEVVNFANELAMRPTESVIGVRREGGMRGQTRARALYDFAATKEDELSFHEGDIIDIISKGRSRVCVRVCA